MNSFNQNDTRSLYFVTFLIKTRIISIIKTYMAMAKVLEYHLPCYDRGVYSLHRTHERSDRTIELEIMGTQYIFHYCESCYYAQANSCRGYGWLTTLLNYIFNDCGIFEKIQFTLITSFKYKSSPCLIRTCPSILEWRKNSEHVWHREMKKNPEYVEVCCDSYNTYYVKRNCL